MAMEMLPCRGRRAVRLVQMAVGIVLVCAAASRRDRRMSIRVGGNSGQRDQEQGGHYRYYPHESKAQCVRLFHGKRFSSCGADSY